MQFSYLHFKHPNILRTSDELSRLNFSLESIISDVLGSIDRRKNLTVKVRKMLGGFEMQIRELHFYFPTTKQLNSPVPLHKSVFLNVTQLCKCHFFGNDGSQESKHFMFSGPSKGLPEAIKCIGRNTALFMLQFLIPCDSKLDGKQYILQYDAYGIF